MIFEHIQSIDDLITTQEKTKEGFIKLALEKSRRASGYVEEGRALKAAVLSVAKPSNLYKVEGIMKSLLTASGLSDKAIKHLDEPAKLHLIQQLIERYLEPSRDFVNELVYRFLLVRGDSFGGSMRNIAGYLAEDVFKRSMFAALKTYSIQFYWRSKKFKEWTNEDVPIGDTDDIEGIYWTFRSNIRTLLFNKNVPLIQKNVDFIVLNSPFLRVIQILTTLKNMLFLENSREGLILLEQMSIGKLRELQSIEFTRALRIREIQFKQYLLEQP